MDDDCNEIAGIRLPVLTVPVATYTGWNLRRPSIGNPELYIGISGGLAGWTLPFPATRGDRESLGAPRLSIEERYITREDYLERVERAGQREPTRARNLLGGESDAVSTRPRYGLGIESR